MNSKKIILIVLSSFALGICSAYFILKYTFLMGNTSQQNVVANTSFQQICDFEIPRLSGYSYIRPLLFADQQCESKELYQIKSQIVELINHEKQAGTLNNASVFIRLFKDGEWSAIDQDELFHPASLMKVTLLIAYLREYEMKPNLLDKELEFNPPKGLVLPQQNYQSETIQSGKKYTIRELLEKMIANSDNNATYVLNQHVDVDIYQKLFTDLGLKAPDIYNPNFQMSVRTYSILMEALYNASYLTIQNSEYATSLLATSKFRDGLCRQLPNNVKIAHKFGEANIDNLHELHESGIIYTSNNTYLITVMTKGTDFNKLSELIGNISKIVYDKMSIN